MLPIFPEFKTLEINDKEYVELVTGEFPPYSDHHFTSLWAYNTKESTEISTLNENIVLKFYDYLTQTPYITFIGKNKIFDTTATLLDYSEKQLGVAEIKMIPEHLLNLDKEKLVENFEIIEDPDNHDYIIDIYELSELRGAKYHSKRQKINMFKKIHDGFSLVDINIRGQKTQQDIFQLFEDWARLKNKTSEETNTEVTAIKRCILYSDKFNLVNLGVYKDNRMIGFSINEVLDKEYYVGHFGKFHPDFNGGFQYLEYVTAIYMKELGCKFMNYEQDLGIPGLRDAKQSWNPKHFLKKYIIRKKKL